MIGVLGGSGNVGRCAIDLLNKYTNEKIRAGCRKPDKMCPDFRDINVKRVDLTEESSIREFIKGCDLILNCAGPSSVLSEKVAEVCISYGCNYVDSGTNRCFKSWNKEITDKPVIYEAGATPGLSGILPVWLGKQFEELDELKYYHGSFGAFSKAAATDYLNGAFCGDSETGVVWQNGKKAEKNFRQDKIESLPFFPQESMISTYFDSEAEKVAKILKIKNGTWNIVFSGQQTKAFLRGCRADYMSQPDIVADKLCATSKTDAAGRKGYMIFLIEIKGKVNGNKIVKTLFLKTHNPHLLTAAASLLACIVVLNGKAVAGVYPFCEYKNTDYIISKISEINGIELMVFDNGISQLLEIEEGEL